MDERQLRRTQSELTQAMDPALLMRLARSSGFCQRMRSVFPHEVAASVIACMATQKTETIADVHRVFNGLTGHDSAYKPFHKKLSKPEFAEFMRRVVCHLLDKLVGDALRPAGCSALSQFDDILLQDGTSFAVAHALQDVFPGRRTTIRPAAVELHATLSVWSVASACQPIAAGGYMTSLEDDDAKPSMSMRNGRAWAVRVDRTRGCASSCFGTKSAASISPWSPTSTECACRPTCS